MWTTIFCRSVICGALFFNFFLRDIEAQPKQEVKVGVSLGLTGGLAATSVGIRNAMILAKEEHDASGRVAFLFDDDQFIPKNTVSIVNRFIVQNQVRALVVFGSSTSLAVADIAERHKVPLVAIATAESVVGDRSYVVRHMLSASRENEYIVREVARRGYATVGVVATSQDGTLALREHFVRTVSLPVVYDQEFPHTEHDFRTPALEIKRKNPSAVYVNLLPPQIALFARQLREVGYKGDLFGAHPAEDTNEVRLSNGAMHGMWYVNADLSAANAFLKRYEKRFGLPAPNYAAGAYDIAKLLIEGSATENLNTYLHTVQKFEGALGSYGANGKGDFDLPLMTKQITPSGFEAAP